MFLIYSLLLTLAFLLMSPLFLMRRDRYAAGFLERLGFLPEFDPKGKKVIWLHCVSVGETNAARSLASLLRAQLPDHALVISTTTKTGQALAREVFNGSAACVFYFPFDWSFTVRRALKRFSPCAVLLMETEIWPNFIRNAKLAGAKVAIVNGRLSQKSFERYSKIRGFIRRVLSDVDLALMQAPRDAERMVALGMPEAAAVTSGNLKFDQDPLESDALTNEMRSRFAIDASRPLIIAASTHDPEEKILLDALKLVRGKIDARMMIVPRHPQRFDAVAGAISSSDFASARCSAAAEESDKLVDVILLDTVGELRAAYPLAELVFCGGSLIPHGGQSMLEPAAEGKAVVTGHHTHNFANAVEVFMFHDGLVQLPDVGLDGASRIVADTFIGLLRDDERRRRIGQNARDVMSRNRGASERTFEKLKNLLT